MCGQSVGSRTRRNLHSSCLSKRNHPMPHGQLQRSHLPRGDCCGIEAAGHGGQLDILGGNHVQDFHGVTLKNLMDHKTGAYGMVQVEICVPTRKTERQGNQFVLVYDQVEGDPETKHCAYIQRVCSDKRTLKCINSWGPGKDDRLLIKMDRPGNQVFRTFAKWIPISQNIVLNFTGPQRSTNNAEILFLISVSAVTFFGKVVPLNFWMRKTVGI